MRVALHHPHVLSKPLSPNLTTDLRGNSKVILLPSGLRLQRLLHLACFVREHWIASLGPYRKFVS
jgi:hypothetical protein